MNSKNTWIFLGFLLTGCPLGDDDDVGDTADTDTADTDTTDTDTTDTDTTDTDTNTVTTVTGPAIASGEVTRSVEPAVGGDAIGTVYIAALAACDLAAQAVGGGAVPNADLSADGASVHFELVDLPRMEVHLAAFLDDDGDADPSMPIPGSGDLVYGTVAGDGSLDCVAVDLSSGDVSGIDIDLSIVAP